MKGWGGKALKPSPLNHKQEGMRTMTAEKQILNSYARGLRDGIPIGLGYLSVSFTFGMMAVASGIPLWAAVLISVSNLTSAGQFAGLSLILASASYVEIAVAQLVINLRYSLMSLSLSQKLSPKLKTPGRMGISFGITDEIFAVASIQSGEIGGRYFAGLMAIPYVGWTLGTLIGAVAGLLLPASVRSALGIAIYGMFLAIVVPAAKKSRPIFGVLLIAVGLSCLFRWTPALNQVSGGFVIIICAVAAAGIVAYLNPVKEEGQ